MSALISQYLNSKRSATNMSKKISIIGGRGFTGQELIKLIDSHPQFELAQAFSSSVAGEEIIIDERKLKITYASLDEDTEFVEEDAIILALPNNEAAKWADKISKQNSQAIILDLSADHRFDGEWHYSVPELTQTIDGNKISNPGCYATAMQLMLAPINNMIDERKLKKTYASLDEDTEFVEEDAIILALPNNEAAEWADKISKQNSQAIILDLSADHRFDGEWHYSVPELTQTIDGNKISNPGCYATAMQLMLAPVNNMIDGEVNFFGISGYSGAGATPNDRNDPNKLKNNIIPYSFNNHIHEREVSFHMQREINFMPHVANFFRGILITGIFL